jgi:adenine-specific DNA-methyltransferase
VAKFEITRTELVWPGKYDGLGNRVTPPRIDLPFQIIETINESRATRVARTRPAQTSLFDFWSGDEGQTFEEGWRNKLIWGDNLLVMSSLLKQYAGKVDLIYIDPPFATGTDFSVTTQVGEDGLDLGKDQSVIEEKAYRDTWGGGLTSYLAMLSSRLDLMAGLLAPTGHIYVHLDYRLSHYARALLDERLGMDAYRNEIIWKRSNPKNDPQQYGRIHDTLLYYAASESEFYPVYGDYREEYVEQAYRHRDPDGRAFRLLPLHATHKFSDTDDNTRRFGDKVLRPPLGKFWRWSQRKIDEAMAAGMIVVSANDVPQYKKYLDTAKGVAAQSIWDDIPQLTKDETLGYPTQKPESLLKRIVEASTKEDGLVADFFCGSGTTASVAERLGRRWIACDLGRFAVHTTRKRLMGIEGCRPFEVLNLGRYERQYWQISSFAERDPERVVFEYLAFMLKLYGAVAVAGMQHIHGKKGAAVVHIGSVDAPVTIDEVMKALDECVATGQRELHVLGWEWEMGLNDTVDQLAVERKVRMKLLAIPREVMEAQAVDRGDIRFFELAHLDCSIEIQPRRRAVVSLTSFALSEADGINPEVLAGIDKWSDFVDYWAVDWDFKSDTFVNGWVAYRTRRERRLALTGDEHIYEAPGTYRIAIKVVDIFGNDTTQVFPVEIR